MSVDRRRAIVERLYPDLSIVRQCALLQISRSGRYYAPAGESEQTLALMRLIDEAFPECPYYDSRQMIRHLRRLGHRVSRNPVSRNRVVRLMRTMGGSGQGSVGEADGKPLEGYGRSTRSRTPARRIRASDLSVFAA